MATIAELRTSRTKLLLDAQKIVTKKDASKEERQQATQMVADADVLEEQIALEERIAKAQSEERSTSRIPRGQPGENITAETREKDRKNFVHYMRTGEIRDLNVGTTGTPLVPTGFSDTLTEAAKLAD